MYPKQKVQSISAAKSRRPVPVHLVLGLPERSYLPALETWDERWTGLHPSRHTMRLEAVHLEDPDTETCPQCELLEKTLTLLQSALRSGVPGDHRAWSGIWIENPVELDPVRLIEAMRSNPAVRLDAVTAWIDARKFLEDFSSGQDWSDRDCGKPDWVRRHLSAAMQKSPVLESWIEQIENCHALVLIGQSDLPLKEQNSVKTILRALLPGAPLIDADRAEFEIASLFSWGLERARKPDCAWRGILDQRPDSAAYFHSKRPFHPMRFNELIETWPEAILRSVGTLWLASHNDLALNLSQVGPAGFFIHPDNYWVGTLKGDERQYALREQPELLADWDTRHGDRMNELAFVSTEALPADWRSRLEASLLNDLEMRQDWSRMASPFPDFSDNEKSEEPDSGPGDRSLPSNKKSAHLKLILS